MDHNEEQEHVWRVGREKEQESRPTTLFNFSRPLAEEGLPSPSPFV